MVNKKIVTFNQTEEDKLISGTYVHVDLIPHIACWISPKFARKVSKIVNDYLFREKNEELAALKGQCAAAAYCIARVTQAYQKAEESATEAKALADRRYDAQLKAENETAEALDVLTHKNAKRNREDGESVRHGFTILKVPYYTIIGVPYYAVRCKRIAMAGRIMQIKKKYPGSTIFYEAPHTVNPINIYRLLQENKIINKIQYKHYNHFSSDLDEEQLIEAINKLLGIGTEIGGCYIN